MSGFLNRVQPRALACLLALLCVGWGSAAGQDLLPPDADVILGGAKEPNQPPPADAQSDLPPLLDLTSLEDEPHGGAAGGALFKPARPDESGAAVRAPEQTAASGGGEPERGAGLEQRVKLGAAGPQAAADEAPVTRPPSRIKASGAGGELGGEGALMRVLFGGALGLLVPAGLAFVGAGSARVKNVGHSMALYLLAAPVAALALWLCGFAFGMGGLSDPRAAGVFGSLGGDGPAGLAGALAGVKAEGRFFGLIGNAGYLFEGVDLSGSGAGLVVLNFAALWTALAVAAGGMLERARLAGAAVFLFLAGAVAWPVYCCWVWGGGWLAGLGEMFGWGNGMADAGGASVAHLAGGVLALAASWVLGPRHGRLNRDGTVNAIPGHNAVLGGAGGLLAACGMAGLTLGACAAHGGVSGGLALVNALLAGGAGAASGMVLGSAVSGRADVMTMCQSLLGGVVSVSGAAPFLDPWGAAAAGALGGMAVVLSGLFVAHALRVDDPARVISTHGVCGFWGCLVPGILANGKAGHGWNGVEGAVTGLFYGDTGQMLAQLAGAGACLIGVGIPALVICGITSAAARFRADLRAETAGLDAAELAAPGYQGDVNPEPR